MSQNEKAVKTVWKDIVSVHFSNYENNRYKSELISLESSNKIPKAQLIELAEKSTYLAIHFLFKISYPNNGVCYGYREVGIFLNENGSLRDASTFSRSDKCMSFGLNSEHYKELDRQITQQRHL